MLKNEKIKFPEDLIRNYINESNKEYEEYKKNKDKKSKFEYIENKVKEANNKLESLKEQNNIVEIILTCINANIFRKIIWIEGLQDDNDKYIPTTRYTTECDKLNKEVIKFLVINFLNKNINIDKIENNKKEGELLEKHYKKAINYIVEIAKEMSDKMKELNFNEEFFNERYEEIEQDLLEILEVRKSYFKSNLK